MYKICAMMWFLLCFLILNTVYAEELRDPTLPLKIDATQNIDDNPLAIKAIIISPTKKIVLVAGRTLTIGDELMEKKIIAIEADSIKLKADDGKIVDVSMFDTVLQKENNL